MMARSDCAAVYISAAYALTEASLSSLRIISSMPNTALMGVRISCDMLARNLLFASFATTASLFASSASFVAISRASFLTSSSLALSSIFPTKSSTSVFICCMVNIRTNIVSPKDLI